MSAIIPPLRPSSSSSSSSPSSSSRLHVFLLLDPIIVDETQRTSLIAELRALGVDDATARCQVHVRSINVPLDRLLQQHLPTTTTTTTTTTANNSNENQPVEPSLIVVWGCKTCPTALYLKDHAACPVISIMDDEKDTAAIAPSVQTAALVIAKFVSLYSPHIVGIKVRRRVESIRQAALVEDSKIKVEMYLPKIAACYDQQRQITGDAIVVGRPGGGGEPPGSAVAACCQRFRGKVRDRWESSASLSSSHNNNNSNVVVMVTTDRQSGFDRQLAVVPFKGSVLNLCSQFWFNATADIIPNHLLAVPHPAVAICRKCTPFPIEFVVRSYMTGSTDTSIWKHYQNGVRIYCGHELPEGMTKNQKLPTVLLTPTTKEEGHDRPIALADIVTEGWMTQADLDVCADAALRLFARGQQIAAQRGLVLVDTKYEFGKVEEGTESTILLIDEIHTPDSSRYWLASSVDDRVAQGLEPENIDKEFLRLWFRDRCDPYDADAVLPDAPRDLVIELSKRYIQLYEMITWRDFPFDDILPDSENIITDLLREQFADAVDPTTAAATAEPP